MNPEEQRENYREMITAGIGLATWLVPVGAAGEVLNNNNGAAAVLGALALGCGIVFKARGGRFTSRGE